MKPLSKNTSVNIIVLLILFGVIALLSFSVPALSQTPKTLDFAEDLKKIQITADKLVANQNNQYIVFTGHVVSVYEQTKITSDTLQVFYDEQADADPDDKNQLNQSSIKKIIASGNVHVEFEDKKAQCDEAVYVTASNSLILSGEDTKLQSEGSYISGNKITFFQNTGQIIVDGSNADRVNAVFQPDEKRTITDIQ